MEDIFLPVMESAVVLASHYARACGRQTVTGRDVHYGLMYAARNVTGRQVGSLFPEIYDSSESDEEDLDVVDDSDEPFTEYTGDEEIFVKMNECARTWDDWEPESPAEQVLKNAVNKAKEV
jgi:hypothetical protein